MIKYEILSISYGKVHSKTKTRPVTVVLKLDNAIAVDESGNQSSLYKTTFRSERKFEVFRRLCARKEVFSIGYETSKVKYKFWDVKSKCWKHKILIPTFTVNESELGKVLFMVKANTLGGANSAYRYKAVKKRNPSLKLIFYSLHGAVVSLQNKQRLKDWAKDIGFEGTGELKSSYFNDIPLNDMVELHKGQVIYLLKREAN